MDSRTLIVAAVCLGAAVGWSQLERLDERLVGLEAQRGEAAPQVAALGERLQRIEDGLSASRSLLDELRRDSRDPALEERFRELEDGLRAQSEELSVWREESTRAVTAALERNLSRLDQVVGEGWRRLEGDVAEASRLAAENRGGLAALIERNDPDLRWRHLVGPTVQLAGSSTVGSGVLLASRATEAGDAWRTEVLTAWHVVRDILPEFQGADPLLPVRIYQPDGTFQEERARLLEHEAALDVAVLLLDSARRFENGARLAPRSRLDLVRTFDRVYAVGCPLGNDPVPTFGEILETHHRIDGGTYWMVSAPTYIGNSGGGIFDADTHELIGIFSKIYTHGGLRPTIVPHMGLAVPLDRVYDWLATRGLAGVLPAPSGDPAGERPASTGAPQLTAPQATLASSQREAAPLEPLEPRGE